MADLGNVLSAATEYGNDRVTEETSELAAELATSRTDLAAAEQAATDLRLQLSDVNVQNDVLKAAVRDLDAFVVKLQDRIRELEGGGNPQPTGTLFGSNLANPIPTDADLQITRVFFDPGSFTGTAQPTFANKDACKDAYDLGCRVFMVSTKDYTAAAQTKIGAFLDTFPDDCEILGTFFHEHEGNIADGEFTEAQYRSRFDQAMTPFRARGLKTGPMHNGMNNVAGKWVFGDGYVEPDLSKCQVWMTDMYDKNAKGVRIFDPLFEYAIPLGLPIYIGEVAQPQGATQTQFAKDLKVYLKAKGVKGVTWWHQQRTGKPNYVMSAATQAAWFERK